jgi:hypothetical protein
MTDEQDSLKELYEHAIEEWESGKTLDEIGEKYGFTASTVLHILQYLGVPKVKGKSE